MHYNYFKQTAWIFTYLIGTEIYFSAIHRQPIVTSLDYVNITELELMKRFKDSELYY